jgi:hypothetical protein
MIRRSEGDEELTAESFDSRLESARPVTLNVRLRRRGGLQGTFYTVSYGRARISNDSLMPRRDTSHTSGRLRPISVNQ